MHRTPPLHGSTQRDGSVCGSRSARAIESLRSKRLPVAACIITILTCGVVLGWPVRARADVPSGRELVSELRDMSRALRSARHHYGSQLGHTGFGSTAAIEVLSRGQVAFFQGDYVGVVVLLTMLTDDPGFRRHPGYGEALTYLGEALWKLGLRRVSLERLREALEQRALPTAYRRTLVKYLKRAGRAVPVDEVRRFWARYNALNPSGRLGAKDRELRYRYAKALYYGGEMADADAELARIPDEDPWNLQARYIRGVMRLSAGELDEAERHFEGARRAWAASADEATVGRDKRSPAEGDSEALPVLDDPPLSATPIRREATRRRRMGEIIHLALARLAATRDDEARAWQLYRQIPPGSPDYETAMSEASFVLFRQGRYDWCKRVIDQVVQTAGRRRDGLVSTRHAIREARLLAHEGSYDAARAAYAKLELELLDTAKRIEVVESSNAQLFNETLLAWTTPDDAAQARRIEQGLLTQIAELEALDNQLAEFEQALAAAGGLPATQHGRQTYERLAMGLRAFFGRLEAAESAAVDRSVHRGDAPGRLTDAAPDMERGFSEIRHSAHRLTDRLQLFGASLERFDRVVRERVAKVVSEERSARLVLLASMSGELREAQAVSVALAAAARSNVESAVADVRFGLVDISWTKKEAINRLMNEAQADADAEKTRLQRAFMELSTGNRKRR